MKKKKIIISTNNIIPLFSEDEKYLFNKAVETEYFNNWDEEELNPLASNERIQKMGYGNPEEIAEKAEELAGRSLDTFFRRTRRDIIKGEEVDPKALEVYKECLGLAIEFQII